MESDGSGIGVCPFCAYRTPDTYVLMHHVEVHHPENGHSPFAVTEDGSDDASLAWQYAIEEALSTPEVDSSWKLELQAEDTPADDATNYVECPTGCGEMINVTDLSVHLDFHFAESAVLEETGCEDLAPQHVIKDWDDYMADAEAQLSKNVAKEVSAYDEDFSVAVKLHHKHQRHRSPSRASKPSRHGFKEPKITRAVKEGALKKRGKFSKAELGPYANEKSMPTWLRKMLEQEARVTRMNKIQPDGTIVIVETAPNQTPGLIPVLAQLSGSDPDVQFTFLCNPKIRHVFKQRSEGGFCGYRNIQCLISYIRDARAPGHEHFPNRVPTILELQDMIEQAWDLGFNTAGRDEIGHIRNTRKYIGTPEAQALFLSLNIQCTPAIFADTREAPAYKKLLEAVWDYFLQGKPTSELKRVNQTTLPPIYLQHAGHSLTVVGLEVGRDESRSLLVFDPAFTQSPGAGRVGRRLTSSNPGRILRAYRRGKEYLRRYDEFEILKLAPMQFPPRAPEVIDNSSSGRPH
ncbi:hypothetical protein VTO42DRAFT_4626 [Malbranchea cinnamomea]